MKDFQFTTAAGTPEVSTVAMRLRRPSGGAVKGLNKLAQEYLLTLHRAPLSEEGPLRGIGGNLTRIRDPFAEVKLRIAIAKSATDVRSLQQGAILPASELLSNVEIVRMNRAASSVKAVIRITSESGETAFVGIEPFVVG